jgi:preprotein translocase subunit Sss1
MIKNKFMRRFSYHEWLMIGIAVTPVIVVVGIVGYLIWAMI